MESDKRLRVAVLGCGSVGSQVVRLLGEQAGDLAARVGAQVELVGVAVRRLKELGLTESLPVGYRLSPRGKAVLQAMRAGAP